MTPNQIIQYFQNNSQSRYNNITHDSLSYDDVVFLNSVKRQVRTGLSQAQIARLKAIYENFLVQ